MDSYDYIIVGAGSAGCVIASVLIERTDSTVLLIEAGQDDYMLEAKMPAAMPKMMANHTWRYATEPEPFMHGRRMEVPQGKVLGGSSSVNGMAYVRGIPQDYDDWAKIYGCDQWDYQHVLKAFKASENNQSLSGKFHGTDGQQHVSEPTYRHPLTHAFMRAGQEMGYKYTTDFNGDEPNGVGFFQTTTHEGRRASTAYSWLLGIKDHPRLKLVTDCTVERIHITQGIARGVVISRHHRTEKIAANKEVIICAGALGSPKLLLLSGIGPKTDLDKLNIPVALDSPQVGHNFQDHLHVNLRGKLREPISILSEGEGLKKYKNGLQWMLYKSGVVTSTILEGCGFFDLDHDGRRETQIHTFPLIENFGMSNGAMVENIEGFTLKLGHLYPESRGHVSLRSADPKELPKIYGNYLSDERDLNAMVMAIKFGLSVFDTPSMRKIISEIIMPDQVMRQSDDNLKDFVRDYALTVFHPVGTCAMGGSEQSVLDQRLRVRGISQLRVIDSSSFPHIISGNTNAPVIMLAYRGANMVVEDNHT